ncbi:hypothetical protein JWJ90_21170 [Desulfobulbus rhabdoformis]|uniref:hypothetical protein n=1 Tax=Desulfobulbus rhabdoformis TaxID=34032 RepID=UPI001963767C|nr:hypothetical protein [Desulfobulbus rhabdoformis]MBM9616778.1 hypothetical protein [Desulfobulbus rhabdoformis]
MKKPSITATEFPETTKTQNADQKISDDILKINDNDLTTEKSTNNLNSKPPIEEDIAEGDVYNKKVPFSEGLNTMQCNAVSLHLNATIKKYANIDREDQQIVNDFWQKMKDKIHEDHGFMSKDTDTVLDVLRKNVESNL